jgi:hypothetical protein
MHESRIRGPGQDGSITPAEGKQPVYEVDPDLPTLRQKLQVRGKHDAWLLIVAVLYPCLSFPVLLNGYRIVGPVEFDLFTFSVVPPAVIVAAAVLLWLWRGCFHVGAVALFAVWMAFAVLLQWAALASIWANV